MLNKLTPLLLVTLMILTLGCSTAAPKVLTRAGFEESLELRPFENGQFSIETPTNWTNSDLRSEMERTARVFCWDSIGECHIYDVNIYFALDAEDFTEPSLQEDLEGDASIDKYVDLSLSWNGMDGSLKSRTTIINSQGYPAEITVVSYPGRNFTVHRLLFFDTGNMQAFSASFNFTGTDGSQFEDQIQRVFESFVVNY